MKLDNIDCPVCKGSGLLEYPKSGKSRLADERAAMAKTLIRAGYSYRQVMRFLGYNSPNSAYFAAHRHVEPQQ